MKKVIDGKRYDTETATVIAERESDKRANCLYRTKKGNYFVHFTSIWKGEEDQLYPVTKKKAMKIYSEISTQIEEFEDAFPGESVEDA